MYRPDVWVVIKLKGEDPHYRVLGGWYGGYLGANSWRLNSGITKASIEDGFIHFEGSSGSTYVCHPSNYRFSSMTAGIFSQLTEKHGDLVELMDEDTAWTEVDWVITK
jgi:hypothetical protein